MSVAVHEWCWCWCWSSVCRAVASQFVNGTYVNYTVIPGWENVTTGVWNKEQYANGTWLNATYVCQEQVRAYDVYPPGL